MNKQNTRLKFISRVLPKSPVQASTGEPTGKYPFFTSSQIQNKFLNYYLFDSEYLIMGTGGSASIHYYNGKFTVSTDCIVLEITDDYSTKFVYYFLKSNQKVIEDLGFEGSGLKHLQKDFLFNLKIDNIPLEQQIQISDYLDNETIKIDAVIAKNKKLIQLLEEKRVVLINHIVTKGLNPNTPMKDSGIEWVGEIPKHWLVKNLKYIATLQTGTTPKRNIGISHEKGINWFTPGDFDNTYKLEQSDKYIEKEAIITNNIKIYPPNSILMVCIGATIGKLGVTNNVSYSNQQITAILPKPNMHYMYLLYYLISNTDYIKETANFTTLPILNNQHLSAFSILCPPLHEQKEIADYLDNENFKINLIISKIKENIILLEEYKNSLIYNVVMGNIDISGEKYEY